MKIVIIDDEYYARKLIRQMIEDWEPSAFVFEAEDGKEAIQIINNNQVDIVITDIRMPELDGLQLAEILHVNFPEIKTVIVSGYDDFSYAQKAIRFQVKHYLLKPVDRKELFAILDEIRNDYEQQLFFNRKTALKNCLFGTMTKRDIAVVKEFSLHYNKILLFHVSSDYFSEISNLFTRTFQQNNMNCIFLQDVMNKKITILWISFTLDNKDKVNQILQSLYIQIRNLLSNRGEIAVGISRTYEEFEQLPKAYQEAKIALLQSDIQKGRMMTIAEISKNYQYDGHFITIWNEQFYKHLLNGKLDLAREWIFYWKNQAVQQRFSAFMILDWYSSTIKTLNSFIKNYFYNKDQLPITQISLQEVTFIEDIFSHLFEIIDKISQRTTMGEEEVDVVESLKNYIMANYHERIVLEELSEQVYFVDPSYLSRLFKKKCGMSFSAYLQKVRMEKAKELLETNPNMTVAEIATAVGYNDYSHFIQVYKRYFGQTPTQYKLYSERSK